MNQAPRTIARPLTVLVPLIQRDLDAAYAAGLEHYRRAGELLLEAKEQIAYGAWTRWLSENFGNGLSRKTAYRYMALAERASESIVHDTTLYEAIGERQSDAARHRAGWRCRDFTATEDNEVRACALKLINLGYKILALRLHPDTGGSTEDMRRLTLVRDVLKRHAERRSR